MTTFSYWGPIRGWWEWLALGAGSVLLITYLLWAARHKGNVSYPVVALLAVVIVVLIIPPAFTTHRLTADELLLQQGLHFTARIPLSDIAEVRQTGGLPFGVGIRTSPGSRTIYAITGARNMVVVALLRPADIRLLGIPFGNRDRIIINLAQPEAFVAAVQSRLR